MGDEKQKPSPGERVREALMALRSTERHPCPSPEFAAFLDTLDAMGFHIVLYLMGELKISSAVIPTLLPLIDQRYFEDRLKFQIDDILGKLENDNA